MCKGLVIDPAREVFRPCKRPVHANGYCEAHMHHAQYYAAIRALLRPGWEQSLGGARKARPTKPPPTEALPVPASAPLTVVSPAALAHQRKPANAQAKRSAPPASETPVALAQAAQPASPFDVRHARDRLLGKR